jgi:hypothetical protein
VALHILISRSFSGKLFIVVAAVVLALLATSNPLAAQDGRIRLDVKDTAGAPVEGAQITLSDVDGKLIQTAHSNQAGEVFFSGLPACECTISVSIPGINRLTQRLTLRNGDDVVIYTKPGAAPDSGEYWAARSLLGRIRIRFLDQTRSGVSTATASIVDDDCKPVTTAHADGAGEVIFDIPEGGYSFLATVPGFESDRLGWYIVFANADIRIEAVLQLVGAGGPSITVPGYRGVQQGSCRALPTAGDRLPIPIHKWYVPGLKE